MTSFWLGLFLAALSTPGPARAQRLDPVTIRVAPAASSALAVNPGGTVLMALEVENRLDFAVAQSTVYISPLEGSGSDQYTILSRTPSVCTDPRPDSGFFGEFGRRIFTVGPLAPRARQRCEFSVQRDASSRDDVGLSIGTNCGDLAIYICGPEILLGYLPDLALSIAPIDPVPIGARVARVRITVRNNGTVGVANAGFGACTDNSFPPFRINSAIPGGCSASGSPGCFDYGFSYAAVPVPAGGSTSCDLELSFDPPVAGPRRFRVSLLRGLPLSGGGSALDPNLANDSASLGVVPDPIQIPALSGWAMVLALALGLLFAAWLQRYRATR